LFIEQDAGDCSNDMIAKDQPEGVVIIENQLGKSRHYHLGKLMTYLASSGEELKCYLDCCSPEARAYPILNITQYLIELS
jgi:hypothetical protein